MTNKLKQKFWNYAKKFVESKQDIDCIRRYRNGCQRILNEMNKNGYDDKDFYRAIGNVFHEMDKRVKEIK